MTFSGGTGSVQSTNPSQATNNARDENDFISLVENPTSEFEAVTRFQ